MKTAFYGALLAQILNKWIAHVDVTHPTGCPPVLSVLHYKNEISRVRTLCKQLHNCDWIREKKRERESKDVKDLKLKIPVHYVHFQILRRTSVAHQRILKSFFSIATKNLQQNNTILRLSWYNIEAVLMNTYNVRCLNLIKWVFNEIFKVETSTRKKIRVPDEIWSYDPLWSSRML